MKVLLDTHVLLWAMQDSKQLSTAARKCIRSAEEIGRASCRERV